MTFDRVECADVITGTHDCLSNYVHTACRVLTQRAALWSAFSVKLAPIDVMMLFTNFTMCSLYRSHWMFLPSPFLVLTKRSHKTWWASCGDRTAFTWNWSLNASRLYLVRPVALKCGSISRQQRKTRSPSPAWAQQRVMLHDQYIQWREFVDKSWLFIFLLFL
jgi:hypothetical protein